MADFVVEDPKKKKVSSNVGVVSEQDLVAWPTTSRSHIRDLGWMFEIAGRIPEVESRTQGSRPRPRPRTQKKSEAKAKAKDSLSEDRHSRGQGQGPRTQSASALQKKKKKRSSQKFFRRSPKKKKKKKKGLHKNFSSNLH